MAEESGSAPKTTVNNTYNVYCKAAKLLPSISQMNSSMGDITSALTSVQTSMDTMMSALEKILEVQQHIHDSHHHPIAHYAEQGYVGVDKGNLFLPPQPDEIDLLIQESQAGYDKDENNLVYIKDFIIDDNDPEKPPVLRDVELHFRYDGISLPSKSMTWSSYLKTLPWCST